MVYVKLQNSFSPHIASVHRMSIHDGAGTLSSVSLNNFTMGSLLVYMSQNGLKFQKMKNKNCLREDNICRASPIYLLKKVTLH